MASQTNRPPATTIEIYWQPGCSSCLRLKEFMEKSGLEYEEVNIAAQPARTEKLKRLGLFVPAACVGEEGVNGVDLQAVAALIGYPYDIPPVLPVPELRARYETVNRALQRYILQIPADGLEYQSPDRDRTFRDLAYHAASVIGAFVKIYDDDVFDISYYGNPPAEVRTVDDLHARAQEMLDKFCDWWERAGQYDPCDRVVDAYWGHKTIQEVLEREVWHTAQHTRQVMMFLERLGVEVDQPLTSDDLAGLPLPDRVWA